MPDQRRNPRNVPPRRPAGRNQQRRRGRSTVGWSPRFLLLCGLLLVAAVAGILVGVLDKGSGNGIDTHQKAVNYTLSDGTKVYGAIGPEGVPLEVGSLLADPDTGLTGAPIDGIGTPIVNPPLISWAGTGL